MAVRMYDIDDQGVDRVVSAAPCMVGGGKERAFLFDQGLAVWRVSPNPATRAPKRLPVVREEFGGNGPGTFLANTGFKVLAIVAQTRDEDIRQALIEHVEQQLLRVKARCKNGEFRSLFECSKVASGSTENATFHFGYEHGTKYMRSAKFPTQARIACYTQQEIAAAVECDEKQVRDILTSNRQNGESSKSPITPQNFEPPIYRCGDGMQPV